MLLAVVAAVMRTRQRKRAATVKMAKATPVVMKGRATDKAAPPVEKAKRREMDQKAVTPRCRMRASHALRYGRAIGRA